MYPEAPKYNYRFLEGLLKSAKKDELYEKLKDTQRQHSQFPSLNPSHCSLLQGESVDSQLVEWLAAPFCLVVPIKPTMLPWIGTDSYANCKESHIINSLGVLAVWRRCLVLLLQHGFELQPRVVCLSSLYG